MRETRLVSSTMIVRMAVEKKVPSFPPNVFQQDIGSVRGYKPYQTLHILKIDEKYYILRTSILVLELTRRIKHWLSLYQYLSFPQIVVNRILRKKIMQPGFAKGRFIRMKH